MERIVSYLNITDSKALNALLIFAAFVILARIVDFLVDKPFRRLARFTKSELDDRIIDVVHRPVFFTIIIIGALQSVHFVKPSEKTLFYANGILYTLLVLIWGVAVARVSNLFIENALQKVADITGLRKDVIPLIENVWKVVIVVAGLMIAFSVWNINITPLLASAGIVGVAVALAAKDTLSNFFGGISVFVDRPYKIGDYIVLETGERGEVIDIGIRSTRIKTRDDILISIPNSIIANTKIINESAPVPNFRVRIPIGVAYGSDIDLVEKLLIEIALKNDNVLNDPPPRVRFRQFGASSLNFELLCWAKEPALRGRTIHELNTAIYKTFNSEGIKIPFPQMDVHFYKEA
jgi:small-conductance mechanosensitive channel